MSFIQRKSNLTYLGLIIGVACFSSVSIASDSCSTLLTQGIYNVTSTSSASEGEAMAKSQFCQKEYSYSSSSERAAISASFLSYFSVGGDSSDARIIEKQKSVCTSGFSSSSYSNYASSYSRTIYQGALDAWNKCNELSARGVIFELQPDNTNLGVVVSFSSPVGSTAKFYGFDQTGLGSSVCKHLGTTITENFPTDLSSANKFTLICSRNKNQDISGSYFVDAQSLFFDTSAGVFQVPLSGTAMLSHSTVDQVLTQIPGVIDTNLTAIKKTVEENTSAINNIVSNQPKTYEALAGDKRGTTVPIPEETIIQLCGDIDGCSIRMGMYNWDGRGNTASRYTLFFYNSSTKMWRSSLSDKYGQNNNRTTEHIIDTSPWSCYFTDGQYGNWKNNGDNDLAFGLLSWNQYNATCRLTIID